MSLILRNREETQPISQEALSIQALSIQDNTFSANQMQAHGS